MLIACPAVSSAPPLLEDFDLIPPPCKEVVFVVSVVH